MIASQVAAHEIGGDPIQPRDGAFSAAPHVGSATPGVKKRGRHQILRRASVAHPTDAEPEDRVGVPIKQPLESLGLAGHDALPELGVRRLPVVTHFRPMVAYTG
jgi:hypothetical protein